MQQRSYLFLLVVVVLAAIFGVVYSKTDFAWGLDVKGGSRFTFQVQYDKDPAKAADQRKNLGTIRSNVQRILENRVQSAMGVVEGSVTQKGEDQFVIELPGIKDTSKAADYIGKSASIRLYWARNVQTRSKTYRRYNDIRNQNDSSDKAEVDFEDGGRIIKPGTPEYSAMIDGWDLILQGSDLENARPQPMGTDGKFQPVFNFSSEGSRKLSAFTSAHKSEGEKIAFVLDGVVLSCNPVADNTVLSDNAILEGAYSADYVRSLTSLLNSGALPVDLKPLSTESVDPTIGRYALSQMINAGLIALIVIAVFMVGYYSLPGIAAVIALGLYILFTLTTLKVIGATFSLAGIAGFILSVGMAVDANILVFERFKEEMKSGKSLRSAMELGFKRALPAIIDSNACTIMTGLVLANFGTGPVKGFATTLIIGVLISLFTAVSVTRSLLLFLSGSGIATNEKAYAINRSWFARFEERSHHEPLLVVQKYAKWFWLSAATIVIGAVFVPLGGFKLNVEFQGGVEAQYSAPADANGEKISRNLEAAGFKGGNVKISTDQQGQKLAIITLPNSPLLTGNFDAKVKTIADAAQITGASRGFTEIGPTIRDEVIRNAVMGVLLSSSLIVLFLAFRFGFSLGGFMQGLRFGISAIGALVHDILVVFFLAALVGYLAHWEISALFITAMLTIIGFSVHDTIVVFDRMRENLHKPLEGEDIAHLMNRSITQSFARSINTSMTVIVTLAILAFFGTPTIDLKFFCVAMLVGIISGTYSSIYNASPILYLWDLAIGKKNPAKTLMGAARGEGSRGHYVPTRAPEPAVGNGQPAPAAEAPKRTYGQVKRRANQARKGYNLDDE